MTNLFEAAEQRQKEEAEQEAGPLEVVVRQEIGLLDWNFEELNRQLDIQLAKYDGLAFTDDEMKEAKATRANLNKVAKAINDRKIEIKKQFCEPYERFADQAKVLTDKIRNVSGKIDDQVKTFEAKQKEEKRKRITDFWLTEGVRQIDISQVFEERWLNSTVTDQKWRQELTAKKERIRRDLAAITEMTPPEKIDWCLTSYLKTVDLGQTLSAWEEYQRQIQKAEEIKRAREEAEKRAQEAKTVEDEEVPTPAPKVPESPRIEPQQAVTIAWWTYNVDLEGTTEQMKALADFIRRTGIQMTVNSRKKEER